MVAARYPGQELWNRLLPSDVPRGAQGKTLSEWGRGMLRAKEFDKALRSGCGTWEKVRRYCSSATSRIRPDPSIGSGCQMKIECCARSAPRHSSAIESG